MVALITGGSSGIGLEFSRQLAARGCDLVLVSNREDELAGASSALSTEYGVKVNSLYLDLSAQDAAEKMLAECDSLGIEVEILINDAGMFFFHELTEEYLPKAQTMMNLHVVTPVRACVLFGERMKKRGHGYILNMSSMAAVLPVPGITIYSATKAFLKSFGRSYAFELKPYGVKMTTLCPAAIGTSLYGLRSDLMRFGIGTGIIKTPKWLVRKALRKLDKGKKIYKPGFMNVYLPFLISILPDFLIQKIWNRYK